MENEKNGYEAYVEELKNKVFEAEQNYIEAHLKGIENNDKYMSMGAFNQWKIAWFNYVLATQKISFGLTRI